MKKFKTFREDLIERLKRDEELQVEYLKVSFEESSDMPSVILAAIRNVAEARGFTSFAKDTKLNRENLYRVLSKDGNPRMDTFFKILDGLGLRLRVETKPKVS